ncbi:MAG: hypothetical protein E4G96_00225 [Chrysiogenales bacterium]|nr:MAG: hypothetical protein E4G96_00225 [Chrysiogenales bacterium]
MNNFLHAGDLEFLKFLVIEAGDMAKKMQDAGVEATRKRDSSIVTRADLAVQEFLIERITLRFKGAVCIHEENNRALPGDIDDDGMYAIIDPIDGTAMYSMYLPVWCVSVGIFRGATPLHGFVYSPGFNMLFYNDGGNAYLNDRSIRVVRGGAIDSETNIFYASEVFHDFSMDFPGKVRNLGSTALQACLTIDNARNRTLAFIGKSHIWDWAGAIPIILKAGGNVRYMNAGEFRFRDIMRDGFTLPDYCIVYNHDDFDTVRRMFRKKNQ